MSTDDLTIEILREIRDEVRATRTVLKAEISETRIELSARIDATNEHLGESNDRLAVVEGTLKEFAGQHLMLTRYVKNVAERHDGAIDELDDRVTKLETHPKLARKPKLH